MCRRFDSGPHRKREVKDGLLPRLFAKEAPIAGSITSLHAAIAQLVEH